MRFVKTINVKLASLQLPGGWKERLDQDNVAGLVEEFRAGRRPGSIRILRAQGAKGHPVAHGFHRIAAALEVGLKTIRADVVVYDSPEEREKDWWAENLKRRSLSPEEKRRGLAFLVGQKLEEAKKEEPKAANKSSNDEKPRSPGRPESPTRQAIKAVAKETGLSEKTVERAVKEPEDETPEPPVPTVIPPCLDWMDLEPVGDVDAHARKAQAQVAEMDRGLIALKKLITGAREAGVPNAVVQTMESQYDALAHTIRRAKPAACCLFCKGRGPKGCNACGGLGWMSKAQVESDWPAQVRLRGDQAVRANGKGEFVPLRTWANSQPLTEEEKEDELYGKPAVHVQPRPGKKVADCGVYIDGERAKATAYVKEVTCKDCQQLMAEAEAKLAADAGEEVQPPDDDKEDLAF